ncbi:3-oxoacyl-[acyl-carrier protein] reductase (plasmid) [Rhodococcus sp. WAY2]|nr:3-oxoacyl-[acyl-carrier protein] reductase [Rhodococcus sp. WAY2]
MAQLFASEGATVLAADVNGTEGATPAGFPDSILPHHCDVTDVESVDALVDFARRKFGGIDILCNNAGIGTARLARLHECSLDEFDRVFAVNVRGAMIVLQRCISLMLDSQGGAIVNSASIAGFHPPPGAGAYAMSKGAMVMLTRQAAVEYAADGIRVNAICPGPVDTPLVQVKGPEFVARLEEAVPLGRLGQPTEVANVALFLASDEASWVTGQCYVVDGGKLVGPAR